MTTAIRSRPDATEHDPYFARYIDTVPAGNVTTILREDGKELYAALAAIPESRGDFRYAADKWSVREVIGHLIDAERVFAYRALRIARGDSTPLASFDQDSYVRTAGSDQRTIADLAAELRAVRDGSVALFASLREEAWDRKGTASGKTISVRALAYIVAGHSRHHLKILRERYLVG
ncbi:MAG: DinB family protein [Gemmatimonadales bacterium]|jgi:uncharacterized damage-inducible protein DinB